jgi:hypothetical protein
VFHSVYDIGTIIRTNARNTNIIVAFDPPLNPSIGVSMNVAIAELRSVIVSDDDESYICISNNTTTSILSSDELSESPSNWIVGRAYSNFKWTNNIKAIGGEFARLRFSWGLALGDDLNRPGWIDLQEDDNSTIFKYVFALDRSIQHFIYTPGMYD